MPVPRSPSDQIDDASSAMASAASAQLHRPRARPPHRYVDEVEQAELVRRAALKGQQRREEQHVERPMKAHTRWTARRPPAQRFRRPRF